jgi:hypothetical protein
LFSGSNLIDASDDWEGHTRAAEIPAHLAPTDVFEAAILATLDPGAYTAVVRGFEDATGVGIIEIFEVDATASLLSNISTRGFVGTGDDVLIGGVIINGTSDKTVTIRARGPSLAEFGVSGLVADPVLELFDVSGALIDRNDNWRDHQNANLTRSDLRPSNDFEATITRLLPPGAYTAVVRGANQSTGIGIVEVFDVQ